MQNTIHIQQSSSAGNLGFHIRRIDSSRPWQWLRAGWEEYRAHPWLSTLYGLLFTAAGWAVIWQALDRPTLLLGMASALLLIAPVLAVGLYESAHCRACGNKPSILGGFKMVKQKLHAILLISIVLLVLMVIWLQLSAVMIALRYYAIGQTAPMLSLDWDGLSWLLLYVASGLLFATAVFVTNNLSLPMVIERDADPATAMMASIAAVKTNPGPMFRWAATIVALTLLGMITAFVGFIVIFPLLGYATWHAYRDLVGYDAE